MGDRKTEILAWLSQLAYQERHRAISDARMDGVGDWLLRTEEFSAWCTLEKEKEEEEEDLLAKPVLFCYGDPGVGKTFISSLVIDTLRKKAFRKDQYLGNTIYPNVYHRDSVPVAYVYCDFSAQNELTASTVLGSVLRQLFRRPGILPYNIENAFERAQASLDVCNPPLVEIREMLIESLSDCSAWFICIDALDEFPIKERAQLWDSLRRIVRKLPKVRLFLTGRPQIRGEVVKYFPGDADTVSINPTMEDIASYIEHRLDADLAPDGVGEELRRDILRVIPEEFSGLSGLFLLVALKMDAILGEVTVHKRRQVLGRMINGLNLGSAYGRMLDRIRQQGGSKGKFGMEALMWISHCERPLKSEELCNALGVELGEEDFNTHNVPSEKAVLSYTLGLVTIDEVASTVHLLHPTLQEYLTEVQPLSVVYPACRGCWANRG